MLRESVWLTVRFHRDSPAADAGRLRHDLVAVFLDGFAGAHRTGERAASPAPADAETANEPALVDLRRTIRGPEEAVRDLRLQRG